MNFSKLQLGRGYVRVTGPIALSSKTTVEVPLACLSENVAITALCRHRGVNISDHERIFKQIKKKVKEGCYLHWQDMEEDGENLCQIIDVRMVTIDNKHVVLGTLSFIDDGDLSTVGKRRVKAIKNSLKDNVLQIFFSPVFRESEDPKKRVFLFFETDI